MRTYSSSLKVIVSSTCATHIVQDGLSATVTTLLPVLAEGFGLTYAQVGALKGLKSISQAVLEMISGWLSERFGARQLIVLGLILSGVGYLLMVVAPSVGWLGICLLFVGVGTALHHAPSSALIANGFTKTRRSVLGVYNASGDVGKLAFTAGFSVAILAGVPWQQVSLLFGVLTILAALGIGIVLRRVPGSIPATQSAGNAVPPSSGGWGILNWRAFGALLMVTGIDTLVQSSVMVFISFLMLAKGLSLSWAVASTALLLAGGVIGKAGCGYLAQRMGVRVAFVMIQLITAIGLITLVLAPVWLAVALIFPIGAAVQGTSSITYGFAADLIDQRHMARGYALLYSSGSFASAFGPLGLGAFGDLYGIEGAFWIIALIALLAIPPVVVLREAGQT